MVDRLSMENENSLEDLNSNKTGSSSETRFGLSGHQERNPGDITKDKIKPFSVQS